MARGRGKPGDGYEHYWIGSLAVGMRDASGQMYMRNRYYDPQTGQFTQPDPIGLAGGLNAYGFAAGDPVSYSDPYGLCPGTNGSGEICVAFFIMTETTLFGQLQGDGRGFSSSSDPAQSRAYVIIDPRKDERVFGTVDPSCDGGGGDCKPSVNSQWDFVAEYDGNGGYNIHASIVNSKVPGPKIDANFSIVPDGNGGYRATGTRDGYPSVEAYHYRTDGTVQTILQQREGKPRELWGCCDKKVP